MSKPPSLKVYAESVLAVHEVNRQVNFEETSSLPRGKLYPPKSLPGLPPKTRQAIATLTRESVLLGIAPSAALAEFEPDLDDLAQGMLTRRALRFALQTVAMMRCDHFISSTHTEK
jgi:hypothetical protein